MGPVHVGPNKAYTAPVENLLPTYFKKYLMELLNFQILGTDIGPKPKTFITRFIVFPCPIVSFIIFLSSSLVSNCHHLALLPLPLGQQLGSINWDCKRKIDASIQRGSCFRLLTKTCLLFTVVFNSGSGVVWFGDRAKKACWDFPIPTKLVWDKTRQDIVICAKLYIVKTKVVKNCKICQKVSVYVSSGMLRSCVLKKVSKRVRGVSERPGYLLSSIAKKDPRRLPYRAL